MHSLQSAIVRMISLSYSSLEDFNALENRIEAPLDLKQYEEKT